MADAAGGDRLTLPEFTRSLRGFASLTALGTRAHEIVFGPLLAARRSAARVMAPEARVAAFDADRLRRALTEAIATLAKDRGAGDGPTVRALVARLEERAEPAFAALDAVAASGAALRAAPVDARQSHWAAWCAAVQQLFNATDEFYLVIDEVAPASRGPLLLPIVLLCAALAIPGASASAQHSTVRVVGMRYDSLAAHGFDVVGTDRGSALVVADPAARARLGALGLRVSDVSTPGAARTTLRQNLATATTVYRSYDDPARGIRFWVDSMVRNNPRVFVDTIGRSYEGRPMMALKIGQKDDSPTRPNVIFMATYHAREWAATEMAERLVKYLAAAPGTDARRDSLVQTRDIWVLLVANPDGYQYTFTTDRLWRKTRSVQPGGTIGVDMNRNHAAAWGLDNQGSSPDPMSDIYRGPSPESEIEVRNIVAFHAAHPPVISLSYHTYAGLLIYPPGSVYGALPADAPVYRALAGTNLKSAVADNLPGSIRTQYAPGPGWLLYTTNGEYTEFAAGKYGALSFTQELTSGYDAGGYYGFEFPDNESLLAQMFQDALPFALDLLDAAHDPMHFHSASTGLAPAGLTIESAAPWIAATVPSALATSSTIAIGSPVPFHVDSTAGGKYTRRMITTTIGKPLVFSVTSSGATANFSRLTVSGAESGDPAWTTQGGVRDSTVFHTGTRSWYLPGAGSLTTPSVVVPANSDTVTIAYWTLHYGTGFAPTPFGVIDMSTDAGTTWKPVLKQVGSAPQWYSEHATIGGVAGKSLTFRFTSSGLPWYIDDAAVIAHGPVTVSTTAGAPEVRPSENPVRSSSVRFAWPFGTAAGDVAAFDFTGREVWRHHVSSGEASTWDISSGVANGVYVIVAKSGSQLSRIKLFVARKATQ